MQITSPAGWWGHPVRACRRVPPAPSGCGRSPCPPCAAGRRAARPDGRARWRPRPRPAGASRSSWPPAVARATQARRKAKPLRGAAGAMLCAHGIGCGLAPRQPALGRGVGAPGAPGPVSGLGPARPPAPHLRRAWTGKPPQGALPGAPCCGRGGPAPLWAARPPSRGAGCGAAPLAAAAGRNL